VAVLSPRWPVRDGSSRSGLQLWWWLSLVPAPLPSHGGTVMTSPKGRNQLQHFNSPTMVSATMVSEVIRLLDTRIWSTERKGTIRTSVSSVYRFLLEWLERWLCTSAVGDFDTSTMVQLPVHTSTFWITSTRSFPGNSCCAGVFLLTT